MGLYDREPKDYNWSFIEEAKKAKMLGYKVRLDRKFDTIDIWGKKKGADDIQLGFFISDAFSKSQPVRYNWIENLSIKPKTIWWDKDAIIRLAFPFFVAMTGAATALYIVQNN